jgi:hypothetical protein
MLQQMIRAIFRGVFAQVDTSISKLDSRVAEVDAKVIEMKTQIWADVLDKERRIAGNALDIQAIDGRLKAAIADLAALTGVIDDKNLDSIREIAERIKSEAKGVQDLREELTQTNKILSDKIDSKTAAISGAFNQDWDQIISAIAAEEAAKI